MYAEIALLSLRWETVEVDLDEIGDDLSVLVADAVDDL
jgi:hypothetical protein